MRPTTERFDHDLPVGAVQPVVIGDRLCPDHLRHLPDLVGQPLHERDRVGIIDARRTLDGNHDGVVVAEALFERFELLQLGIVDVEEAGVGEIGLQAQEAGRQREDEDQADRHRAPRVRRDEPDHDAIESRDVECFQVGGHVRACGPY
jgi:hypothetical protein